MNKQHLRDLLSRHWAALAVQGAAPAERRMKVAQLPVVVDLGPLAAAVDHEGRRHLLLPVLSQARVRAGLDGPVLHLRKHALEDAESYQMYADLACLKIEFDDLFDELCVDVLHAVAAQPDRPLRALHQVLDRWRALFKPDGTILGPEQQAGLFAELIVLTRLLARDPGAHRLWLGPRGHRHDFTTASMAVEVKSAVAGKARRARIHGLDQLDAPTHGRLWLAWFALRKSGPDGGGTRLVAKVDEARRLCDDEGALLELLADVGYRIADADRYHDVAFELDEECWYHVDPNFPGLTATRLARAGLTVAVTDVDYTIDLSSGFPAPLTSETANAVIGALVEETR